MKSARQQRCLGTTSEAEKAVGRVAAYRLVHRCTCSAVMSNILIPVGCCACSSGGGGGAKGPSIVDKRGQEEKCPHCDRVFKQNSRLKEHIAKQHADQQQDNSAEAAGTAVLQQPQQSGPGRPGSAGASSSSSSSSHQQGQVGVAARSPTMLLCCSTANEWHVKMCTGDRFSLALCLHRAATACAQPAAESTSPVV
jgi:hypothetical protein